MAQNQHEKLRVHLFNDGRMHVGATNKRNKGYCASSQLLEGGPLTLGCHLHRAQQSRGDWKWREIRIPLVRGTRRGTYAANVTATVSDDISSLWPTVISQGCLVGHNSLIFFILFL